MVPTSLGGWPSAVPLPLKAQGPISCPEPTQDAYLNSSGRVPCRVASSETMGVVATGSYGE